MLWPTPRLLWFTFWLVLPGCALAGISMAANPLITLYLLIVTALLGFDAYRLNDTVKRASVTADGRVSAYKDRPSELPLTAQVPPELAELDVALALPDEFQASEPVISTRTSGKVSMAFTPSARGEFPIRRAFVSARSTWGLWRLRSHRDVNLTVQVFPDLSKDPASQKLFAALQQGPRIHRFLGRGREVERLRDYAPGDSFDEIYWKATARRGSPVSKVFQVERTQDIYAIVDGSRLGNRNQALERFVSASLLLAIAAEKNTDNFGLLTFGDRIEHFVRAAHGKDHFHRCREAIYDLQPALVSPDFNELFTFINLRIRKRALLFFLTDLSDPLLAETFLRDARMVAHRHVVMVNQIADAGDRPLFTGALPGNELEVQSRLAGHLQWAKLRELERALSHNGIRMRLLKPEQASTEMIGQYMDIKRRQLL
jgi:uncharacterized protein (DUF58 family)